MDIQRTAAPTVVAAPSAAAVRSTPKVDAPAPPEANRAPNAPPEAEGVPGTSGAKAASSAEVPQAPSVSTSLTTRERVQDLLETGQLIASFDLRFAEIYLAIAREAYQAGAALGRDPQVRSQVSVYT